MDQWGQDWQKNSLLPSACASLGYRGEEQFRCPRIGRDETLLYRLSTLFSPKSARWWGRRDCLCPSAGLACVD
eukprot:scaffold1809_cov228-Pinguiococcus_pyrenoidosus.AAC.6